MYLKYQSKQRRKTQLQIQYRILYSFIPLPITLYIVVYLQEYILYNVNVYTTVYNLQEYKLSLILDLLPTEGKLISTLFGKDDSSEIKGLEKNIQQRPKLFLKHELIIDIYFLQILSSDFFFSFQPTTVSDTFLIILSK